MAASPSPSSDDQFPIGSLLDDRYRIEAVLGTGGMGRVYRAARAEAGTPVAIKVLHADLTRNREASQRFKREVLASSRLAHPNIVGFSEGGVLDDGACYLVMEMLEGESLGDRLSRDTRIPWHQAVDILRSVLHGLDHAHRRNVVHRDIKPDNVYLADKDGELVIKILDFGIAKFVAGDPDDPALTRAGLTVGTPAYLSPEQAVGGAITPASDLYSASVVMYEMLAGRAPFEDKDPLAMLGAHVSRPPPRFADVAPGLEIPPELEDIVQHGLRKAPAERIGTAAVYLERLDEHWPPQPGAPRPGAPRAATARAETAGEPSGRAAVRPAPRAATPVPGAAARAASLPGAARTVSVEMAQLPRAVRAVSLADVTEQIPLTWIVRSGVLIGLLIIAAIALAIGAHCRGSEPAAGAKLPAEATTDPGGKAGAGAKADPDAKADPGTKADPGGKAGAGAKVDPGTKADPGGKADSPSTEPAASPGRAAPAPRPASPGKPPSKPPHRR